MVCQTRTVIDHTAYIPKHMDRCTPHLGQHHPDRFSPVVSMESYHATRMFRSPNQQIQTKSGFCHLWDQAITISVLVSVTLCYQPHFATKIRSAIVSPTIIAIRSRKKEICGVRIKSVWLAPHEMLESALLQDSFQPFVFYFIYFIYLVIPGFLDHFLAHWARACLKQGLGMEGFQIYQTEVGVDADST